MRTIIILLLFTAISFANEFPTTPSIYEIDPSLERFNIAQDTEEEILEELEELENKPSLWWRVAGWGTYLACGTNVIATQYRKERAYGPYSPLISNDFARAFTAAGIAEGSNIGSEFMRKKDFTNLSFITRIGTLAACGYSAVSNFRNGWKRR